MFSIFILSRTGIAVLSIAGFFIALHIHRHKRQGKPLMCPMKMSCDTVVNSDYAHILTIPLEFAGMAYYAFTAVGSIIAILMPQFVSSTGTMILSSATLIAFLISMYLIYVQARVIKAWCSWCLFSALICAAIFALSFV